MKRLFYYCEKVFILMNIWMIGKKLNKTLTEKNGFHSHLKMEDATDTGYVLAKTVCKDFEMKKLGEYHDLYEL